MSEVHDPLCPMNNALIFSNTQCECDLIVRVRKDERERTDAEWFESIARRTAHESMARCLDL